MNIEVNNERRKEEGREEGKEEGIKKNNRNIANLWDTCPGTLKYSTLQTIKIGSFGGREKHK